MLRQYARDKGFIVKNEYVDDGISGTTFERPNFQRMIADIEAGKIGIVLCKDLSRLGRNNAMVAYFTEIHFVVNNVRFIAVNDCIDTSVGENEIMPFKSVINEYYARDISKKTRSTFRTMAAKGQFVGSQAPYGYIKDPEDCHRLLKNEETAPIVQLMFDMASKGINLSAIRRHLTEKEILTPLAYLYQKTGKFKTHTTVNYPTDWSRTAIMQILKNRVYLGHMVSQKYTTKSFKSKKVIVRPKEEWVEVKNTHESLVSQHTFDVVQSHITTKHRPNSSNSENVFIGILRCSDCGSTLNYHHNRKRRTETYACNRYCHSKQRCTAHYVTKSTVVNTVLYDILRKANLAKEYENDFEGYLKRITADRAEDGLQIQQKAMEKFRSRCAELDNIIKRLFEQSVAGTITDERFMILSQDYETEQKDVRNRIEALEEQMRSHKSGIKNAIQFFEIIRSYTGISELDSSLLHELIEKIVIYESNGLAGKNRIQRIEIHYRFVGVLPD